MKGRSKGGNRGEGWGEWRGGGNQEEGGPMVVEGGVGREC